MAQNKNSLSHDKKDIHTENEAHLTNEAHVSVDHHDDAHGEHIAHEVTIYAEPVYQIGNFTVTNAMVNSWIVVFILAVFALVIRRNMKTIPGKLQGAVEVVMEAGMNLCDNVTGDRKQTKKVFPFIFTLFTFILVNNYMGLLPGIGTIGYVAEHHGELALIPYFRGGTADLNSTLALSFMAVLLANLFGVISVGLYHYADKFLNLSGFKKIPKNFVKNKKEKGIVVAIANIGIDVLVACVKLGVGMIEVVGEFAKVASLSLRLFGNIFAGEVLLASIAAIAAYAAPIPFLFLELIVGLVQALVFSILTLVYFTVASLDEH